jgi:UPF0716 protein FxsA
MLRLIFGLLLIALPFAELALLIKTGQTIGFWATLALVIGAGLLGAIVWSHQGLSVARKARAALAQGKPPVGPVLDGAFLLLAGLLLIMPGFLTDVAALLLLVPPVRRKFARWSIRRLVERTQVRIATYEATIGHPPGSAPSAAGRREGPVIEGEFERLGETSTAPHRGNGRDPV